jgi:hypothetical protein
MPKTLQNLGYPQSDAIQPRHPADLPLLVKTNEFFYPLHISRLPLASYSSGKEFIPATDPSAKLT